MSTLIEFADKMQALRDEMKASGKDALLGSLKGFFDEFPEVKELRWAQYTPYFNDGEPCEFSVNDVAFFLDPEHENVAEDLKKILLEDEDREDDWYEGDGWRIPNGYNDRESNNRERELKEAIKNLNRSFSSVEELFLLTFGDHMRIRATRDGIECEEHDHD